MRPGKHEIESLYLGGKSHVDETGFDGDDQPRSSGDIDSFVVSNDFIITNSSGCTVEVTKPAEAETVYKEESITVQWNRTGNCGSRVSLDLFRNTGYILPLQVSARIYNEAPSGTFGQYVHGWTDGEGFAADQWGRLLQLRQIEGQLPSEN